MADLDALWIFFIYQIIYLILSDALQNACYSDDVNNEGTHEQNTHVALFASLTLFFSDDICMNDNTESHDGERKSDDNNHGMTFDLLSRRRDFNCFNRK